MIKKHIYILFFLVIGISLNGLSQTSLNIISKKINFGYKASNNRVISNIIIHSVYNNLGGEKFDIDLIIKQFSKYKVSSHYVINRDGQIFLLVDESNIAFHAGKSILPNGKSNINNTSIGIELINSVDEVPTENQINSLILLVKDIKKRHNIIYVLRHSDIAPDRKTDPWNFDWDFFLKQLEI